MDIICSLMHTIIFFGRKSSTQGALTGVGLSLGYPMALNGSSTEVVVISANPVGPDENARILPETSFWQLTTKTRRTWIYMMQQNFYSKANNYFFHVKWLAVLEKRTYMIGCLA
jgi:hypothetical protein